MQAHIYNDKELFQLISEGDETAFRRLFHAYVPQLRPLVQHITRTSAITEDIIQDTFLKLWISRDKLTDIDNPRSWILRIVFHQSFSWLRRQAVHHKAMDIIQQPDNILNNSTEETVAYNTVVKLIGTAVQQLPPQAKRIYLLSRENGLKIPEIAAKLHISQSTVKNSLVRSLHAIRKYLEASGHLIPAFLIWLFRY